MVQKYYEPAEDTYLLLETAKNFVDESDQKIWEIGVGSGYIISNIAKQFPKNKYFASDINKDAINNTKKLFAGLNTKITLKNKSLLTGFKEKFDLIIFNTPYLPCEGREKYDELSILDKALYGGKLGYEVIEEFIYQLNDSMANDGSAIIIFSSLSNLEYIKKILKLNYFEGQILKEENHFFETIYSFLITKSKLLQNLSNNLNNIKYLALGKHSTVLEGKINSKKFIIKIGLEKDIQIETLFLEKLKSKPYVPKIFKYTKIYVIREKLEGTLINEFFHLASKKEIIEVLDNIFEITYDLDKLKINKSEMTNPYKHIYIDKKLKVSMIDFERCLYTDKPRNTTQFIQYLNRFTTLFKEKGFELDNKALIQIGKTYRLKPFKLTINDIVKI